MLRAMTKPALKLHMVDFNFQKSKNQNKQQYFTDNHHQLIILRILLEFLAVGKKVKQIRASTGPGSIFRFINIKEFPSPRTLLKSK